MKNNYLRWFSDNKNLRKHGLGNCITEFAISCWDTYDFCSKKSKFIAALGKLINIRDPRRAFSSSNFHTFCAESGYLPAEFHNEYVGESILHELPGYLCQEYGKLRRNRSLVKMSKTSKEQHFKKMQWRRKTYNINEKVVPNVKEIDEWVADILGLDIDAYIFLMIQCMSDPEELYIPRVHCIW